jgi:hypothetical protein
MLHGKTKIAGLQPKLYKTLQKMASKTTSYTHEINGLRVVQGELCSRVPPMWTKWHWFGEVDGRLLQ